MGGGTRFPGTSHHQLRDPCIDPLSSPRFPKDKQAPPTQIWITGRERKPRGGEDPRRESRVCVNKLLRLTCAGSRQERVKLE